MPAGAVNDEFLTSLELFPSFAAATGALMLRRRCRWTVTIGGRRSAANRNRHEAKCFGNAKISIGARVGKWKWVDMGGKAGGLFDLEADIGETNDLSQAASGDSADGQRSYTTIGCTKWKAEPRGPFRDF